MRGSSFAWTIGVAPEAASKELLDRMIRKAPTAEDALRARSLLEACTCAPELRGMAARVLALVAEQGDGSTGALKSFLVELIAGVEYARTTPGAGKMKQLRSLAREPSCAPCFEWLRNFCDAAERHVGPDTWFELRAACMDAYALGCILRATADLVIYYAGDKHAQTTRECLVALGARPTELPAIAREYRDRLVRVEALARGATTVVLLGENHFATHRSVAEDLLRMLKAQCSDGGRDVVFMIEQHISNADRSDEVPRTIMCNRQDQYAIQRLRCDEFVDSKEVVCPRLRIVQVDNRHVDLGFLRTELMHAWREDEELAILCGEFTRAALRSVSGLCRHCLGRAAAAGDATFRGSSGANAAARRLLAFARIDLLTHRR